MNVAICCSPRPSMSMAPRDAKCDSAAQRFCGQSGLRHRCCASPSGRTSGCPHDGHSVGKCHSGSPSGRISSTGPTTSGMTSPALRTMTVSPGRTSLWRTWSSLCSVERPTVEPPTKTGSSTANGVALPVRPMETWMSRSTVVRSSGGSLNATAHRGALEVNPNACWTARSSTFTTTPSMS